MSAKGACIMKSGGDRLSWLDNLRGLAVIFVFLLHAMLDVQRHGMAQLVSIEGLQSLESLVFGRLDFGKIGVAIFFIISGFLIPVTLNKQSESVVSDFVWNRAFRLYPAYWVSILLFVAFLATDLSVLQVAVNFTMLQRFVGVPDLSGVYWTLQIELIFYALCVVLKLAGVLDARRLPMLTILAFGLLAVALAVVRYMTGIKMPVAVALALQLMFFGYLWRRWSVDGEHGGRAILSSLAVMGVTLAIACPLSYSRDYGQGENWTRYLMSYGVAVTLFCVWALRQWSFSWLRFIGRCSYSFYLIHAIVIALVVPAVLGPLSGAVDSAKLWTAIALSAVASLLVSWLLYKSVEEPGVRLGKWLLRRDRVGSRLPASATAAGDHGGDN